MSNPSISFLDLILEAWKKTTLEEYHKNKEIWWIERDITNSFYYYLRHAIELLPQYELFSEWHVKFSDNSTGKIDFAIVEPRYAEGKAIEAFIQVAIEVKWAWA